MKNKIIIICGILFVAFNVNAQYENDTIVYWGRTHSLQWCNFQGKVPVSCGKDKARSSVALSAIYFNAVYSIDVRVLCFFNKMESWRKDTSLSLLKHEQLHFDISELYARKIRKEVSYLKKSNNTNIEEYKKSIDSLLRERKVTNELYDEETDHSKRKIKQIEWEKKIAKDLETLKEYEVDYSDY